MRKKEQAILVGAVILFALWVGLHFGDFRGAERGVGRLSLGLVFSLLVLLRPKPVAEPEGTFSSGGSKLLLVAAAAFAGTVLGMFGVVFGVKQLEWVGLLALLFACLQWSLPGKFRRDITLSLFLLYWTHSTPDLFIGPLQRGLQAVSVHGAELLLQAFNQRVWADGLCLRTGAQVFLVPEACSGMATATTVLLCCTGIGILFRFKLPQLVFFLVFCTTQVVLLNILRIALMVVFSDPGQPAWAERFIHDSLGVLLLAAIVLTQLEAAWWRSSTERMLESEERDMAARIGAIRRLPMFWQALIRSPAVTVCVILILLFSVLFYARSRPPHLASMIASVASDLLAQDNEQSERAYRAAMRLDPGNNDLKKQLARVLLVRGKPQQALDEIGRIPERDRGPEIDVLRAWGLVGTGRSDDAVAVISNTAAVYGESHPGVAMVRAELAAQRGEGEVAADMVVKASESSLMLQRVRDLFPFLASVGRFDAIVNSDRRAPYRKFPQALIAINAYLDQKDVTGAAQALTMALKSYGNEYQLLRYCYTLAGLRPGGS